MVIPTYRLFGIVFAILFHHLSTVLDDGLQVFHTMIDAAGNISEKSGSESIKRVSE